MSLQHTTGLINKSAVVGATAVEIYMTSALCRHAVVLRNLSTTANFTRGEDRN